MSQREDIVAVAAKEIGYKEYQNNNNKYGVWYGMNNQPWCAIFVSWCAAQIGVLGANNQSGIIPRTAWVPDYQTYYSGKGLYRPKGSYTPRPGDIILYGSNSHVGLVEQVSNGKVITIEGNTSANGNSSNGDGVYRRTRSLTDSWIKGYCVKTEKGVRIYLAHGVDYGIYLEFANEKRYAIIIIGIPCKILFSM